MGVLLTWRRPGHRVGWIFAAAGLVDAVDFATFEYGLAASAGRRHLPAAGYVGWAQLWLWVPFVALVTVYLFLLFPDGRLPSPRWLPVGWLAGGFTAVAIAGLSFNPGSEGPNLPVLRNPFGVTPAAAPFDAIIAGEAGLLCCVVLAAWSLRVEITDDGAGFVPADAAGTGLTGLADRIEAVGGGLSIRSRPGAGTRLAGELPARGRSRPVPDARCVSLSPRTTTWCARAPAGSWRTAAASMWSLPSAPPTSCSTRSARLRPGVVITDIRMPPGHHMEGIAAAQAIRAGHPGTGVVVLSQHADDAYAFELFKNGTGGLAYLLKDRVGDLDELRGALTAVASGGSCIDPVVVEALVSSRTRFAGSALRWLTPRELDVLREMARGRANPGIAAALVVSESAVEKHVSSIFAKLGLGPEPAQDRRVTAVLTFLRDSPPPCR